MAKDERPDHSAASESSSLSGDAEAWGRTFIKLLRNEYAHNVSVLPTTATQRDYFKAMIRAILEIASESSSRPDLLAFSLDPTSGDLQRIVVAEPWTDEKNVRRLELIDKSIEQVITAVEAIELERLTAQLRDVYDREEYVPLEGARRLLQRLLDSAVPNEESK